MRSSTIVAVAAAVAAPALVAAAPTSASGSEAVSLGTVWDVAKDGYNAIEAGKGLYDSFKNKNRRELVEELIAREFRGEHGAFRPNGFQHYGREFAHEYEMRPATYSPEHYGHHAREALYFKSLPKWTWAQGRSVVSDIDDGVKVVGDAANAATDVHNAYESWKNNHRRAEREHYGSLRGSGKDHKGLKGYEKSKFYTSQAHAREDNGSGAISIGSIFDIAKDGYDAYESYKNNHRRGADGSEAISLSTIGEGINLVSDAANAATAVHDAYEAWKKNHRRAEREAGEHYGSLHTSNGHKSLNGYENKYYMSQAHAREDDGSGAISIGSIFDIAKDGYDAYESYKNNHRRTEREEGEHYGSLRASGKSHKGLKGYEKSKSYTSQAHAREDDGSGAISIGSIFDIAKDGYDAYESLKNNHRRTEREAGEQYGSLRASRKGRKGSKGFEKSKSYASQAHAREDDGSGAISIGSIFGIAKDGYDAYESLKNNHRRSVVNDIDDGLKIVGDGANAVTDIHNAYESFKHSRSLLDELD